MHTDKCNLKAQMALEFSVVFYLAVLLFIAATIIYSLNVIEANAYSDRLEATRICNNVAATINSFAATGGNGSIYRINLTNFTSNNLNYTVTIATNTSTIKVNYANSGVGCRLQTRNITNSAGNTLFQLNKSSRIYNNAGVLRIVP